MPTSSSSFISRFLRDRHSCSAQVFITTSDTNGLPFENEKYGESRQVFVGAMHDDAASTATTGTYGTTTTSTTTRSTTTTAAAEDVWRCSPQQGPAKHREDAYPPDIWELLDTSDINNVLSAAAWTLKVDRNHRERLQMTLMSVMSSFGLKVEVKHTKDRITEYNVLLEARLGHFLETIEPSTSFDDGIHSRDEQSCLAVASTSLAHRLDKVFSTRRERRVLVYAEGTIGSLEKARDWIFAHFEYCKEMPTEHRVYYFNK